MNAFNKYHGLLNKLLGRRPLSWLTIRLTNECNSRCRTCNSWRMTDGDKLTASEWQTKLASLYDYGYRNVELVGGEVLLRNDLAGVIRAARIIGYKGITVSTNALLLNPGKLDNLIQSGVTGFHFSVDGLEASHDAIRGVPGSFRHTIEVLTDLQRYPQTGKLICTTILQENVHEIPEIILLAKEHGCRWCPNLLDDAPYLFQGIKYDRLALKDPRLATALYENLLRLKQWLPETIAITEQDIPFIRDYLIDRTVVSSLPCCLGAFGIYLDPAARVYSSCLALEPIGDLRTTGVEEIFGSDRFNMRLTDMFNKKCPGCTCNYSFNNTLLCKYASGVSL